MAGRADRGHRAVRERNAPPRLLAANDRIARVAGARFAGDGTAGAHRSSTRSCTDGGKPRHHAIHRGRLLIFLGLLGTSLASPTTVPGRCGNHPLAYKPTEGEEGMAVFGRLMNGLEDQLAVMGTAFASSLLGLAGSLCRGSARALCRAWARTGFTASWRNGFGLIKRGSGSPAARARAAARQIDPIATVLDQYGRPNGDAAIALRAIRGARAETEARIVKLAGAVEGLTGKLGPGPVEAKHASPGRAQERLAEVLEPGGR